MLFLSILKTNWFFYLAKIKPIFYGLLYVKIYVSKATFVVGYQGDRFFVFLLVL